MGKLYLNIAALGVDRVDEGNELGLSSSRCKDYIVTPYNLAKVPRELDPNSVKQ